jgi:very-short-patch-repair endonuclease
MGPRIPQSSRAQLWNLVSRQHGVVTRSQLLRFGYSAYAIKHRIAAGRLHPVRPGVYAVGRPRLSLHGRWLAAVLYCGPGAALSHQSAAALWEIRAPSTERIEVSVPLDVTRRHPGIVVHRRTILTPDHMSCRHGIAATNPICTLIDLAVRLERDSLEAAINEADKLHLTDPEALRSALDDFPRRPGSGVLREVLDRQTFMLADSALERRFLAIAREAGLPAPETGRLLNGFRVDFHWQDLGLVVETDGLRYHRTPAQQAKDRLRDQTHTAAGLTTLRFTHAQVRYEPDRVRATLAATAQRLSATRGSD